MENRPFLVDDVALPGVYRLPNLANLIEFQVFIGGSDPRG
jgi:hypothetical protein